LAGILSNLGDSPGKRKDFLNALLFELIAD
jgi:hypothetical protein